MTHPISLPPPPSSSIADMETTVTIYSSDSEGNSRLMVKYWIKIVAFADEARVTLLWDLKERVTKMEDEMAKIKKKLYQNNIHVPASPLSSSPTVSSPFSSISSSFLNVPSCCASFSSVSAISTSFPNVSSTVCSLPYFTLSLSSTAPLTVLSTQPSALSSPSLTSTAPTILQTQPPILSATLTTTPTFSTCQPISSPLPTTHITTPPMALPVQSSENVELLQPIDRVLANNSHLRQSSTIGKLACKLAREAVFGTDVMKRCTPYGTKQYPPCHHKIK